YGKTIMDWQVTSDGLLTEAPTSDHKLDTSALVDAFKELRKLQPSGRLGISEDARFWNLKGTATQPELMRGLREIRDLKQRGAAVDFFAMEASRPIGLWASGEQIYDVFDAYAKEGVKIHITDFGVPVGVRMEGSVREGTWTPQLQADYYRRFF